MIIELQELMQLTPSAELKRASLGCYLLSDNLFELRERIILEFTEKVDKQITMSAIAEIENRNK